MSQDLVPIPSHDLDRAAWRFVEFFTANIRNRNTRAAYAQAVAQFFRWCEARGISDLDKIKPVVFAAMTFIPRMGAPLPGTCVRIFRIFSPASSVERT